jgi:hypothetical protein
MGGALGPVSARELRNRRQHSIPFVEIYLSRHRLRQCIACHDDGHKSPEVAYFLSRIWRKSRWKCWLKELPRPSTVNCRMHQCASHH